MIRYCFNPFGKNFQVTSSSSIEEHKAGICEFLTLAFALGENMDIIPTHSKVLVNDVLTTVHTNVVTVDLDYRLETNDFIYIISEDSSVTRNVESLDKPYATTGRLYGLLTTKYNSTDFKKDSDDFIKLIFHSFTITPGPGESEILATKNYMYITSNVNSTLTESYKPLSSYQDETPVNGVLPSAIKYYDLEDLAVDAVNSTTDNAITKNIMKKPMLVAKMVEPNRKLGVQQFLEPKAPITLKRF